MGSKLIWKLAYRQGFTFIGTIGEKTMVEKISEITENTVTITKLI